MQSSRVRVGRRIVWLIAVVSLGSEVPTSRCCADAPKSFSRALESLRSQSDARRVMLVVSEDSGSASSRGIPLEVVTACRDLVESCREKRLSVVLPARGRGTPEVSLARAPSVEEWSVPRRAAGADAVIVVIWKLSKTSLVVRSALLDERSQLWTGRTILRAAQDKSSLARRRRKVGNRGTALASNSTPGRAGAAGFGFGGRGLTTSWFLGGPGGSSGTAAGAGAQASTSGSGGGSSGVPTTLPELNRQILAFAIQQLGQQVGNGQCYTLPIAALASANADPPIGNDFGQAVPLSSIIPGDILRFETATLSSGVYGIWHLGEPYHYGIVGEVQGTVATVYHSNINGDLRVRRDLLDLGSLVSGRIVAFRAVRTQ